MSIIFRICSANPNFHKKNKPLTYMDFEVNINNNNFFWDVKPCSLLRAYINRQQIKFDGNHPDVSRNYYNRIVSVKNNLIIN